MQVSVSSNLSPPPQLIVSLPDPTSLLGINVGQAQGFLTPTNPVSFFINATALAQPLQKYPFLITASDNSNNTSVFTLPLTVIPFSSNTTATRSTFARTDQSPTGMVYDQPRKLLFVSVEILNEVVVLSSVDGHQVATIPVNYPSGIDEATDGSAVYVVSPYFGNVTTIDPNLFQVVRQSVVPKSVSGSNLPPTFFQVAALSNGKVLLLLAGEDPTQPPFFLWDPTTDLFSRLGQTIFTPIAGLISRSTDHSKVLAYGGGPAILYDATTDTFTGPSNSIGGYLAIGPDGSQIVSVGLQNSPTVFYDSNFNALGSLTLGVFPITGVLYSLDGKHFYVFIQQNDSSGGNIAAVVDTKTFSVIGLIPGFSFGASLPFSGQWITTFGTDESNMLFGAAFRGVGFLDMSSPTFLKQPFPGSFQVQPELASLSSPTQAQLDGAGFSQDLTFNLFVGPPPASPQSLTATNLSVQSTNFLNVTIPSGTTAGPANATLTRSDGFFEVMPDAVTFGPTILRIDADTGSPSGGDSINIVGYGLTAPNLQVAIGGKSAAIGQQIGAVQGSLFPTERVKLTTPPGSPGKADVTVTTPDGSITLTGGFHYVNSVHVYPRPGALDAINYDQAHQRLYVTNQDHNQVEIFDLGTSSYLTPVAVGNAPTALALTPDGKLLAVVNSVDGTVSVVDPVKMQVIATYTLLTSADMGSGCGGVVIGMAPAAPHRMLVDVNCPATLGGGLLHLINLDTGSLTCTGVAGCSPNGTDINLGNAAMASTADGSKVFLASFAFDGAVVSLLDLQANTLTSGFSGTFADAAASADGTIYAASFGISNAQLARIAIMAYEPYADSGNQSLHNVVGEKLNPSGSLLFVPQDSGVDILDVHTGRLVRHLVLPDPIPLDTNALVLDETGTKMFLISNTGVTIAQLHDSPLSLATVSPASGPPGTSVTLRGSGFQNGATVTFGSSQVSATFVDSNTLQTTVPSLQKGSVRVTVTNPDGHDYTVDSAFAVD